MFRQTILKITSASSEKQLHQRSSFTKEAALGAVIGEIEAMPNKA